MIADHVSSRGGVAMLTRITGGDIIDPVNGRLGKGDLWIRDDEIVEAPPADEADRTIDASGCIVMAGAIDIHSHIGGGNVNTARLLLPEQHAAHSPRPADDAAFQCRLVDLRDRLPLRQDGLHDGRRAGDVAGQPRCTPISSSPTSRSSTRRRWPSSAMTISCCR